MPFDVVKRKDRPITGRQLSDSLIQCYSINYGHGIGVFRAFNYLNRRFTVFSGRFKPHSAFAEVHEDLIDCQAVKPSRKSGFAPKTTDFSKELYKDLLSEVFGLRDITSHSQAQRVNATIMALVKRLEGCHIALSSLLPQLIVCRLRCIGFGCGHVLVCSGKLEEISQLPACAARIITPFASFKGAALFLRTTRVGMRCQGQYPQTRL